MAVAGVLDLLRGSLRWSFSATLFSGESPQIKRDTWQPQLWRIESGHLCPDGTQNQTVGRSWNHVFVVAPPCHQQGSSSLTVRNHCAAVCHEVFVHQSINGFTNVKTPIYCFPEKEYLQLYKSKNDMAGAHSSAPLCIKAWHLAPPWLWVSQTDVLFTAMDTEKTSGNWTDLTSKNMFGKWWIRSWMFMGHLYHSKSFHSQRANHVKSQWNPHEIPIIFDLSAVPHALKLSVHWRQQALLLLRSPLAPLPRTCPRSSSFSGPWRWIWSWAYCYWSGCWIMVGWLLDGYWIVVGLVLDCCCWWLLDSEMLFEIFQPHLDDQEITGSLTACGFSSIEWD